MTYINHCLPKYELVNYYFLIVIHLTADYVIATSMLSSATHCSVYLARNYFPIRIGSLSLTRHRTSHTIGPPIRLRRVVVIPILR